MKQNVNYISHHKNIHIKMIEDTSITSIHISLYNALFLIWNECGFDTELSINRNDVMKLSKIGSANTYTKGLKMLDKLGYIKYIPSYNPLIGSIVNLYRYDKGSDKGSVKSSSKGTGKGCDTLYKPLNKETIKPLNKVYSIEIHDCLDICLEEFPKQLHPEKKDNWLDVVEKLNRIEKIPFDLIIDIVQKTRRNVFWSSNFLSMPKLRKKNKDDLMYIVVFNEQFKNKENDKRNETDRIARQIQEQYPGI